MYDDLQKLLSHRYELVTNRITALRDELETLVPEQEYLVKLISTYSKRAYDTIHEERTRIFNRTATEEKKEEPKPTKTEKRAYTRLTTEQHEELLLQVFTNNNNTPLSAAELYEAINEESPEFLSVSTVRRIACRAKDKGILKQSFKPGGNRPYYSLA